MMQVQTVMMARRKRHICRQNSLGTGLKAVTLNHYVLYGNFQAILHALTSLYKILASLAVTSCSAERVISRIRIVKNRLRSTMVDDWFAPLTVLACERDATLSLKFDEIVDRLARHSVALKKHLL